MTRKKFIHNMQRLAIAIHKHPTTTAANLNLGKALRAVKENAKNVPMCYGSYESAWNMLREARKFYGIG